MTSDLSSGWHRLAFQCLTAWEDWQGDFTQTTLSGHLHLEANVNVKRPNVHLIRCLFWLLRGSRMCSVSCAMHMPAAVCGFMWKCSLVTYWHCQWHHQPYQPVMIPVVARLQKHIFKNIWFCELRCWEAPLLSAVLPSYHILLILFSTSFFTIPTCGSSLRDYSEPVSRTCIFPLSIPHLYTFPLKLSSITDLVLCGLTLLIGPFEKPNYPLLFDFGMLLACVYVCVNKCSWDGFSKTRSGLNSKWLQWHELNFFPLTYYSLMWNWYTYIGQILTIL